MRPEKFASTQPVGVRTEMPRPLSSHTKRTGTGRRWKAAHWAALKPDWAVAWLVLASPKLHTTMLSAGTGRVRFSLAACSSAIAVPTALGRWLAMVDVWGSTQVALLPHTLWRPPETGSSRLAARARQVS